jgi:hypothetical protein
MNPFQERLVLSELGGGKALVGTAARLCALQNELSAPLEVRKKQEFEPKTKALCCGIKGKTKSFE